MYDKDNTVIYVGKAKDLQKRVSQYFLRPQAGKVFKMVQNVDHFETIIVQNEKEMLEKLRILNEDRANFDRLMKEEYQKLNDQKIDFEQEKTKVLNEIQDAREELARKNKEFEKYREEQVKLIKDSKKELAKNCEQFEKIVASFNSKIENFD